MKIELEPEQCVPIVVANLLEDLECSDYWDWDEEPQYYENLHDALIAVLEFYGHEV